MKNLVASVFIVLIVLGACGFAWFLCLAIVLLVVLPPALDPAIRFKEWVSRKK